MREQTAVLQVALRYFGSMLTVAPAGKLESRIVLLGPEPDGYFQ